MAPFFYVRLSRKPSCNEHWLLVKSLELIPCSGQAAEPASRIKRLRERAIAITYRADRFSPANTAILLGLKQTPADLFDDKHCAPI